MRCLDQVKPVSAALHLLELALVLALVLALALVGVGLPGSFAVSSSPAQPLLVLVLRGKRMRALWAHWNVT